MTPIEKTYNEIKTLLDEFYEKPKHDPIDLQVNHETYIIDEYSNLRDYLIIAKANNKEEYKQILKTLKEYSTLTEQIKIAIIKYNDKIVLAKTDGKRIITKVLKLPKNGNIPKKLVNAIKNNTTEDWNELFNRSDEVKEFYKLYLELRMYAEKTINFNTITNEKLKQDFLDALLLQTMILYYLEKKGFFKGDENYLEKMYHQYKNYGYNTYYEFLIDLLKYLAYDTKNIKNKKPFEGVTQTGTAPVTILLSLEYEKKIELDKIQVPDEIFYGGEELTEYLRNYKPTGKKPNPNVKLLNLMESRDWLDDYDKISRLIGDLLEKLMNTQQRKLTGSYYTPEEITTYICQNTIHPYILEIIYDIKGTNKKPKPTTNYAEEIKKELQTMNLNQLKKLYLKLLTLSILDPAVGSGHFLETALETLTEIYLQLYQTIKEKYPNNLKEFKITYIPNKNNIKIITFEDLKNTDENTTKMIIKSHIIIERNLYGADINEMAVKLTQARMFMNIAKHYNHKKQNTIDIPNIRANIKVGNSLIGLTTINETLTINYNTTNKKQLTLTDFFGHKEDKFIKTLKQLIKEIKKNNDLFEYLYENKLIIEKPQNIIKQIETNKKFKDIIKLKAILDDALTVETRLEKYKNLYNTYKKFEQQLMERGDEIFIQEYNLNTTPEELKNKIGRLHWPLAYPQIIIYKKGFDIIIGNPPYGNILSEFEKKFLKKHGYHVKNIAGTFIMRTKDITKPGGITGLIVPEKLIRAPNDYLDIMEFITNTNIQKIVDTGNPFKNSDVTLQMIIIVYKNEPPQDKYIHTESLKYKGFKGKIPYELAKKKKRIYLYVTDKELEIIEYLEKVRTQIDKNKVSVLNGKFVRRDYVKNGNVVCITGTNIDPFIIDGDFSERRVTLEMVKENNRLDEYNSNVIMTPDMKENFEVIVKPTNTIVDGNALKITIPFNIWSTTIILNSKLINYYVVNYTFNRSKSGESANHISKHVILDLPLIIPPEEFEFFGKAMHLLHFKEFKDNYKHVIDFYNKLINALIYEQYFANVIYGEKSYKLLDIVRQYLKELPEFEKLYNDYYNYVIYNKGNYKSIMKQANKFLSIVLEVYENIRNDKRISELVDRIYYHKWVKIIEENI